jgi:VanZ family protein
MDNGCVIRCVAWALAAAVTVFTFAPIEARPTMGSSADVERFIAFTVMGGAFALGYPKRSFSIICLVVAIAGVLEIVQHFVPGRHARIDDAMVKAGAAVIGVATAIAARP